MKDYKLYKQKYYNVIPSDEFKSFIAPIPDRSMCLVEFDFATNKFNISSLSGATFHELMSKQFPTTRYGKLKYNSMMFFRKLFWNVPFARRGPSSASLYTDLVFRLGIMCLVDKKSETYKKAHSEYALLYDILDSKAYIQPVPVSGNIGTHDELESFLYKLGRKEEAKELSDIWMNWVLSPDKNKYNTERRKKESQRIIEESRIAHENKLRTMIVFGK